MIKNRPRLFPLFVFLLCSGAFFVLYLSVRSSPIVSASVQQMSSWKMEPNAWSRHNLAINCQQLIAGDEKETRRSKKIMKSYPKEAIPPEHFLRITNDCEAFKKDRAYIMKALHKKEEEFPIAYSITIYKDIEQFERLLRAIYRPQNYYCVHVDSKSPKIFHRAAKKISSCFPNVFLASRFVNVKWGTFTVLEAYLICMRDMLIRYKNWKYFINLTGQEFPLKTNNELVKILKRLNGRSLVTGSKPQETRIIRRYHYVYNGTKQTETTKAPFAYNFTFFKGSTFVALSRDFANFSLNSHVAKEFLEHVQDTGIPDETFLPSLFYNGVFPMPTASKSPKKAQKVRIRYVNWSKKDCYGKRVRSVCVHGVGALKLLTNRPEPFVNKFHLDYQYLALDCMEQWLYNKTFLFYTRRLNKQKKLRS